MTKTPTSFDTGVFRKKTFSALGLKPGSFVSNRYKFNLTQFLVDRAYKICSSYKVFSLELGFLKRYLSRNNFPLDFVLN